MVGAIGQAGPIGTDFGVLVIKEDLALSYKDVARHLQATRSTAALIGGVVRIAVMAGPDKIDFIAGPIGDRLPDSLRAEGLFAGKITKSPLAEAGVLRGGQGRGP